ncbi:MAG: hypothetical protein Q7S74_05015 [Nanoarchaeota archaeon]|nr:hypothetical protein [Nanoarchaeota archaeon]
MIMVTTLEGNEVPHPHIEMANFVNNYNHLIRPAMQRGNYIGAKVVIMESQLRFAHIEESCGQSKEGSYTAHKIALSYLAGWAKVGCPSDPMLLKSIMHSASEFTQKLELILQGDEIYEAGRKRRNEPEDPLK